MGFPTIVTVIVTYESSCHELRPFANRPALLTQIARLPVIATRINVDGIEPSVGKHGTGIVRYLWFTSTAMIIAGVSLVAAAFFAGQGPIALVCGLLLLWSGVVKVVVLRIWQKTLANPIRPSQRPVSEQLAQPPVTQP